jgi:hypothetical protein
MVEPLEIPHVFDPKGDLVDPDCFRRNVPAFGQDELMVFEVRIRFVSGEETHSSLF